MTVREFNLSVDEYADRLYRFILKSVRDTHFAEDIVQDSFERLWKNVSQVNNEKVKSYLFTTAYHAMIDRIRKEKRVTLLETLPYEHETTQTGYSDARECLNEAVNRLPEVQRSVLILRDFEGYTYEEIGELTGLSESQVKVYIYRARVFLKNFIGKMDVLV